MREQRLRVVHIGKFYAPARGGMERVVQLLAEGERARSIDSRVLAVNVTGPTVHEEWRGVPVTRVRRFGAVGSVSVCPAFPLWLSRVQADVVVLHEPNPVALAADLVGRPRGRLIVWFHSEVVRPSWRYALFYRPFFRRVLTRAASIVTASPVLVERAAQLEEFREKCTVIPYGIDVQRLALTPDVERRAAEIRRLHGDRLVLFVGRLVPYKGVDILLQAMRRLDGRALLVGDGPLRATLEARCGELGVKEKVVFAGEVPDREVVALYHACDVLALPSVTRAEAFGIVQLEAMACGKPVVSTNLPTGVPWVNRHGQTGFVVAPGDAAGLHDALERILSAPATARQLGANGRQRVGMEFTTEKMIGRTVSLYHQVADSVPSPSVSGTS